jgi:prepilin-type N-terminal cleavage/methylation domain-containing protein
MKARMRESSPAGFTLIELLVVIAIVALLIAVMIPSLIVAKERCRRVVCLSNVRQFTLGLQVYANQNESHFPAGTNTHTFKVLESDYHAMADSIGDDNAMFCPNLGEPFLKNNFVAEISTSSCGTEVEGHYIGYNYLGGHKNTPWSLTGPATSEWESALTNTCRATMPIVTELNSWSTSYNKTVAPHGNKGAYRLGGNYMNEGLGGITSGQLGATGGNVGYLDGSGHWKRIAETNIYRVSIDSHNKEWYSTW